MILLLRFEKDLLILSQVSFLMRNILLLQAILIRRTQDFLYKLNARTVECMGNFIVQECFEKLATEGKLPPPLLPSQIYFEKAVVAILIFNQDCF